MDNTQNQRAIPANESDDASKAQENQPTDHFDTLSDEIHLEILKKVPQSQLDSLALVCSRFSRIIEDRSLWKKVVRELSNVERGDVGKWIRRQVQHLSLNNLTIPSLGPTFEATQPSWSLKELCLSYVETSPSNLVKMFNKCKQLKKVDLDGSRINNDVLVALSENKNIERVWLRSVQGPKSTGLGILIKNLVKLQELYVDGVPMFTLFAIVNPICENLAPSLLHLTLGESICRYDCLRDDDVARIARKCPLLQSLKVPFGRLLSHRSTESLRILKHLRILQMRICTQIRPAAFLAMATELESLVELDMYDFKTTREERRDIEEMFGVNIVERHSGWHDGTFKTPFGVVRLIY